MKSHFRYLLAILIVLLSFNPVFAQSTNNQPQPDALVILDTEANAFPTIRFTARVQDANGQAITGLSTPHFNIDETHDSLGVVEKPGNIHTVFVINGQPFSVEEKDLYRDILNSFNTLAYSSGDTVAYTFTTNTSLQTASTPQEIAQAAHTYPYDTYPTSNGIQNAIERARTHLAPHLANKEQVQIVFIGSYITGSVQNDFTDIPTHVIRAYLPSVNRTENGFADLATGHLISITDANANALTGFLTDLNNMRTLYEVSYTSRAAAEGLRSINVSVSANGGSANAILQYQFDVSAPSVEITRTQSSDLVINREPEIIATPSASTDAQYRYTQSTETLTVNVSFPDGHPRMIQQAWLIIDGVDQTAITPNITGNSFDIQWDLSPYETTRNVSIAVGVQDSYGVRQASTTKSYTINVPEFVAPTVEINPCINEDGTRKTTAECTVSNNADLAIAILAGQILIIVALVGFAIWQYRRIGKLASSAGQAMTSFATGIARSAGEVGRKTTIALTNMAGRSKETTIENTNIYGETNYPNTNYSSPHSYTPHQSAGDTQIEAAVSGQTVIEGSIIHANAIPDNALAIFVVEKGEAVHGPTIIMRDTMTRFSFGRDEAFGVNTEALIAMPGISRIHCTVSYNHSTKEFMIEDHGSGNKTRVNNQQVMPNSAMRLENNAQIRLSSSFAMRFVANPKYLPPARPAANHAQQMPRSSQITLIETDEEDTAQTPHEAPIPPANQRPNPNQQPGNGRGNILQQNPDDPWIN
jgi:pSer/pThr/pTyr-binding forkhead associated (FHA) protein